MGSSVSSKGSSRDSTIQYERDGPETLSFKIVVVGESAVGKSAVSQRFLRNRFYSRYTPTTKVCIDHIVHKVNVPDDTIVSLTLWDIPSKEDLDLSDTYFKKADAAIVVVDVSQKTSLEMAGYWRQYIISSLCRSNNCSTAEALDVPVLLLANKADKIDSMEEADGIHADDVFPDENPELFEEMNGGLGKDPEVLRLHSKYFKEIVKVAEESRFISGVLVSCKSSDGGLQQALQTLVRHLVELNSPVTQNQIASPQPRVKDTEELNEETGINTESTKLKELAAASKKPVQMVKMLQNKLNKAELNFKQLCGDKKIVPLETNLTLEFCLSALNATIEGQHKLRCEDQPDGTVVLYLPDGDVSHETTQKILDELNYGFTAMCGMILTRKKNLVAELMEFDSQIMEELSRVQEQERSSSANRKNKDNHNLEWMNKLVEQTRVDILATVMSIDELNDKATRSQERIKSALLWS